MVCNTFLSFTISSMVLQAPKLALTTPRLSIVETSGSAQRKPVLTAILCSFNNDPMSCGCKSGQVKLIKGIVDVSGFIMVQPTSFMAALNSIKRFDSCSIIAS